MTEKNETPKPHKSSKPEDENNSHFLVEGIKEKQYFMASIIESSNDAIITKTSRGIITSWNNGAENIYGYLLKKYWANRCLF